MLLALLASFSSSKNSNESSKANYHETKIERIQHIHIVDTIDPVPVSQTINVLSPIINMRVLLTACHIFIILPVEKICLKIKKLIFIVCDH